MTSAQSFHLRDDLSTVPSTASAPMEIITHDANRLLEYRDGVDPQRVAEHDDVKDQLDRVKNELKKLADVVRKEAAKSPPRPVIIPALSPPLPPLPDPPKDVLSSGSVTKSIQSLSSPGLPIFQEPTRLITRSGQGSPARSNIMLRQGVSDAQLRNMLNDLRQPAPIQLPVLPPSQPTPRRSPYADLLSQIADTLCNIVEAGEAARELPLESEATETETESIAETEDTGATLQLNNPQNRLQDVLDMPAPPQPVVPFSSVRPTSKESLTPTQSVSRSSPPPASLYGQHIADSPRFAVRFPAVVV
ncbi:hypothetical protein FRC14_005015 [Serendipita sp. 396]|nr:hypothetical protein FRC14_005015 [Serendipita sp. 396]